MPSPLAQASFCLGGQGGLPGGGDFRGSRSLSFLLFTLPDHLLLCSGTLLWEASPDPCPVPHPSTLPIVTVGPWGFLLAWCSSRAENESVSPVGGEWGINEPQSPPVERVWGGDPGNSALVSCKLRHSASSPHSSSTPVQRGLRPSEPLDPTSKLTCPLGRRLAQPSFRK